MNTPMSPDEIDRIACRRAGAKLGWYVHAVVYLAVNLGLAGLAFTTEQRRWSVFPALGWGLGLLLHGVSVWVLGSGGGIRERMVERERARLRSRQDGL